MSTDAMFIAANLWIIAAGFIPETRHKVFSLIAGMAYLGLIIWGINNGYR